MALYIVVVHLAAPPAWIRIGHRLVACLLLTYLTYLELRALHAAPGAAAAPTALSLLSQLRWWLRASNGGGTTNSEPSSSQFPPTLLLILKRWLHPCGIEVVGMQLEHVAYSLYQQAAAQQSVDGEVAVSATSAASAPAASDRIIRDDYSPRVPKRRPTVWSYVQPWYTWTRGSHTQCPP